MKKLSIFALAALAFAACTTPTPENTPDPVMTVDATEYAAGVAEEEFVFNIESNIDWTVTSEADWLEIMPAEGKGNSAVYVTIAANEAYDPREAVVTVAAVKPEAAAVVGEHTITIKQDEAKALVIGKSRFNVAAEASTVTIELSTNVEYTVAFSADWLSEASAATRGLENKTIVVAVAENTEYDDREGTITITSELGEDVVKITQEQKRAVVLGATSFDVAAEGGVIEVPLKRNMSYRASTSVDWITRARETRALEDDVVKFEVAANEGLARTGYIYFETDESTDSVAVNQAKSAQAIVKIADSRFSKFLIDNFDTNDDAEISVAELEAITELNFSKCPTSTYIWSSVNVTNFSGIEYMINLETLNVVNSKATSIDLSNNTKLTSVTIVDTKITSLDVSALTELTYLNVGATPITSLDLSNNTKLTYLCVSGDALAELNVSALTELTVLDCAYNKLTSLDVSKNTKLEGLYCNGNQLTELNVAGLAALGRLNCDHNQIAALDVTANSNLTVLNCGRNKLTSLKVAGLGNLTILSAPHNMTLTSLDLSGLSKLRSLTLPKTGITTLSTAACPELVQVNVNESPNLASLDISASTKITGLVVDGTALTTLDVSKQPKLGSLLAKDPQNTSVTTTPLESITLPDDMNLNKIPAAYIKFESTKWLGGFIPEAKFIDLSANGTANCYVVSEEDCEYKFKATVKGNGVAALSGDTETTIAPTKARLLWAQNQTTTDPATIGYPQEYGASKADKMIIPSSVTLDDEGYIHFKTGGDMPNGNVGIVATDDNDNVLWSWHLWVVKGYNPAATDINVTTKGVNTYFMDRNIGAYVNYATVESPDNNTHIASRGLYYQWGRKDPFIGHQSARGYATQALLFAADGTSKKLYSCYGDDAVMMGVAATDAANSDDINDIVAWTIANPNKFVKGSGASGYQWVSTTTAVPASADAEWPKLWGNAEYSSIWDKGGVKTMYDPCPAGYRVPSTGHYIFITSHDDQASNGYGNPLKNWKFNSVEKIYDESGAPIAKAETGSWSMSAPFGLHFYANGAKTASADAQDGVQDYGNPPADQETVIYFPAQGEIPYSFGCSKNGNDVIVHTNAAIANGNNCYRMKTSQDGNFYYAWTSIDWGQAQGLPVRCIRE